MKTSVKEENSYVISFFDSETNVFILEKCRCYKNTLCFFNLQPTDNFNILIDIFCLSTGVTLRKILSAFISLLLLVNSLVS